MENIIGFVNIYDYLSSPDQVKNLNSFIRLIRKLHTDTVVLDAVNTLQKKQQKIVLVIRPGRIRRDKPIGTVTKKDLVKELFKEPAER